MELTFKLLKGLKEHDNAVMEFVVEKHTAIELKKLLRDNKVKGYSQLNKAQLVYLVINYVNSADKDGNIVVINKTIKRTRSVGKDEQMLTLSILKDIKETKTGYVLYPLLKQKEMCNTIKEYDNLIKTKGLNKNELLEIIKDIATKL